MGAALILSFLLARRGAVGADGARCGSARFDWLAAAGLYAAVVLICWPSLRVGFVADDYAHILTVSKADAGFVRNLFTVPAADHFFRPLGMISYWIDYQWAGFSPFRWHLAGVLWHALNAALVYALARALGLAPLWAGFAGVLFGIHGTRPESITWVSARFELVATVFALAATLLFIRYVRLPSAVRLFLLLTATLFALLSKESAYALPLMLGALVLLRKDLRTTAGYRALAAACLVTGVAFVYRWVLLGGIGGYLDAQGQPTILFLNAWLIVKALTLRLWAVLFVPLNWTDPLSVWAKLTLTAAVGMFVALAALTRRTGLAMLGLALTLAAVLPVHHLLLIGPDLEKSRVVYLGSAGFALFLAAALAARPRRLAYAAALAVVAFQGAALWHNLATWERVSRVHARACEAIADGLRGWQDDAIAVGMPNTYDGVYMLKTGLPECLEVRHGISAARLHNVPMMQDAARFPENLPLFVWDKGTGRVVRLR